MNEQPETKLTGRGGAGRGQGRKDAATKKTISVSLDLDIIDFFRTTGGNLSGNINDVLRIYKNNQTAKK